ncbi:hypothetical protein [Pinirhizobacter soli]|uniref:hypothetical protein n=1 Tax=Pinirhizobacter soli TaxID=2786953 RepID=UPI00202A3E6F|nr:hypothetical protein [Pinirhizobacter soli]
MALAFASGSNWLAEHPHTLISFALGLLAGSVITIPLGWTLPGTAASLVGATVGVAGAVGGGLWAANAKQRQEERRADMANHDMAAMVASAIVPEIASARKTLLLISTSLRSAIDIADKDKSTAAVAGVLGAANIETAMCERFMGQFQVFGSHAAELVEAVGAMMDVTKTSETAFRLVKSVSWSEMREVMVQRTKLANYYAANLESAIKILRTFHPRGSQDQFWNIWLGVV